MGDSHDRPEGLSRVFEVLAEALDRPEGERAAFLDRACGSDSGLRSEVESLIAASDASGVLDAPVADLLPGPAAAPAESGSSSPGSSSPGGGATRDAAPIDAVGSDVGPYRLLEVLGEGGMGTVYRAVQAEPVTREVALKVIRAGMDTREVVARFRAEQQALAVMDHTGIARVFDAGVTGDGRPYFAMELVRGVPIDEYCDTHRLGTGARLELFTRVCEAVHHAHQKGVVHRDLKPSNILVAIEDDRPVPKVIDFGIAKAVGSAPLGDGLVTTMGQMLGTPAYMSPEQAERTAIDVDTRTDVYSLGVVLYQLLSGSLPFDRETLRQPDFVLQYLLREKAVPLPSVRLASLLDTQQTVARNRRTDVRTLRRQLRGDLDWIVMKAMEKDRTRRYASVSELGADVTRFLRDEVVTARPPGALYRFGKFARRHRGALAAGVVLLLSLAAGATASGIGFVQARRNAERATAAARRAEAVSGFLDRMLRAADPVRGGSTATTVEEVLDAASREVDAGALSDQPLVEVGVRRSIGGTYMQLGRYESAAEHLTAARVLLDATEGAELLERVTVLDELGQLRRRQGELPASEESYLAALALADSAGYDGAGGREEELLNRVRNDLGLLYRSMDRIDEAAAILESLVDSRRRVLEPDDVDLATTLNNLALVKRAQGDIDAAIALFHETLAVLRAAFGEEHVYVAAVLESIGSLEQLQGSYEPADSLMSLALEMRYSVLGDAHPDIVNGLHGLALLHVERGQLDEAQRYLDQALPMSIDLLGADHTRTASIHNTTGLLLLRREDAAGADAAFRRAIAIRQDQLGPSHTSTLNARGNLAAALLLGGRVEEAEALAREVVAAEREIGLSDAALYGAALRTWGMALTRLGRFVEAEEVLLQAWTLQSRELGAEHLHTQRDVQALVDLYEAWERPAARADWESRLRG